MGHVLTIRGVAARLLWGYHPAATVGAWTLTTEAGVQRVSATLTDVDTVMVSQRPLTFVVPTRGGAWRFPIETLQITDRTLTASLGPKEAR